MSFIGDALAARQMRRQRRRHSKSHVAADAAGDAVETAACCCIVDELFDPCFVATAAHGSYEAPEVLTLRRYRDEILRSRPDGRAFIFAYYRFGPYGAKFLHQHPRLKPPARLALTPCVRYAERRLRR